MDLRELKEFSIDAFKYLVTIAIVILVFIYVCALQQVIGPSMKPTLNNGDILLTDKLFYKFRDLKRNEIITFNFEDEKYLIKRIIGLPGETIMYKNNFLYIDGVVHTEKIVPDLITDDFSLEDLGYEVIPKDMYLVLGDNREDSMDSRMFGLISKKDIIGSPFIRIWPIGGKTLVD